MLEFRNTVTILLFVAISLFTIVAPGFVYAVVDDVKSIEKLFETYGKNSIVEIISQKRDGSITIEKYNTLVDDYGKPNLAYITANSVSQDLQILKMSVTELNIALDEYATQLAQEKVENKNRRMATIDQPSNSEPAPLSVELNHKIQQKKEQYDAANSVSEKRRLQDELSILRIAYNRAKKNEQSKLRVYFPK